jgi:hypothetical protein
MRVKFAMPDLSTGLLIHTKKGIRPEMILELIALILGTLEDHTHAILELVPMILDEVGGVLIVTGTMRLVILPSKLDVVGCHANVCRPIPIDDSLKVCPIMEIPWVSDHVYTSFLRLVGLLRD